MIYIPLEPLVKMSLLTLLVETDPIDLLVETDPIDEHIYKRKFKKYCDIQLF